MKIIDYYKDNAVPFITEGHKHCRPGWVNIECPFCTGNPGWHLSYNLTENYFTCWRCGYHTIPEVIMKLSNVKYPVAKEIIKTYGGKTRQRKKRTAFRVKHKLFKLPSLTLPITNQHKTYLKRRNFNSDKIETIWGVKGTGPISMLDGINYSHRLLIPIYWDGEIISFTSRDITGKAQEKYKSCPKIREKIEHKHILYGIQSTWQSGIGICVEGPTDVWRMGEQTFGTFGIKYTQQQVRTIAKHFKKVGIFYDNEPQAQAQAKKLAKDLNFRGVLTANFTMDSDPGSLSDEQARNFKRLILQKIELL